MKNVKSALISTALVSAFVLASAAARAGTVGDGTIKYRVTVRNVTAGNVLAPFLTVVAAKDFRLFQVGSAASPGLAQLAETGSTAGLESELAGQYGVVATAKPEGGPLVAGEERSVEVEVSAAAVAQGATLNLAAMIGKSNDSFISARGIKLAGISRQERVLASNFDAGSEENTGNVEDFGAGGHPTAAAEGHVSYDRGLNPRGDAPELLAWGPVAATVLVEKIQ